MSNFVSEKEARAKILQDVKEYCEKFHKKPAYKEGDRIPYASRVYDSEEMCSTACLSAIFFVFSLCVLILAVRIR